jgi:hypothetical protein
VASIPTIDAARHELARTANYEVQALALALRKFIEENDPGAEIAVVSRGILTRISDLSEVVFDAIINDDEDRDDVPNLVKKAGTDMRWLSQSLAP